MQRLALVLAILLVGALNLGFAQKASKPPVKKNKPARAGTAQLPGDNGKLGVVYAMGPKGDQLFFKLESAALETRAAFVENTLVAKANEKLLVLTFTVQNPQNAETLFRFDSLGFTCVAPDDQNWEFSGYVYNPATKKPISTNLKPAQKIQAVAAFPVHGVGPINKLMVQRGEAPVLRYDLRGKVKPLTGPFAGNGIDTVGEGKAELGTPFALGPLDVTVEKVEPVAPGGELEPEEERTYFGATVNVVNNTLQPVFFRFDVLTPLMRDSDGAEMDYCKLLLGDSYRDVDGDIPPKGTVRCRYVFSTPVGTKPTELVLTDPESERTIKVKFP